MKTTISESNSGVYRLSIKAESTVDELLLTNLYKQIKAGGDSMNYFGGTAGLNEETSMTLEKEICLVPTKPNEVAQSYKPKRILGRKLFG